MNTYVGDALPVAITGTPGLSSVSLLDVLKQAYGDQISSISSVNVAYYGADFLANRKDSAGNAEQPFSYWDPKHPSVTSISGVDISPGTQNSIKFVPVDAAHFADVMINVGNNIMPNVYIQVPTAHNSDGSNDYQVLNVTTIPKTFDELRSIPIDAADPFHPGILNHGGLTTPGHLSPFPGGDLLDALRGGFTTSAVPTAASVVSAAERIASLEKGVVNVNDCHFIAMDIAAEAGAPLDPNTQASTSMLSADGKTEIVTETPANNEEGGFWRIAFRGGTDSVSGGDWQTLVKPGDIVRLGWLSTYKPDPNGFHTTTVVQGLNADGHHPGMIEVVDNADNKIQQHWVDYNSISNTAEVTIYRIASDGLNLIDGSSSTNADTFLGTAHDDLMKAGSGGDTLLGGAGNDKFIGGIGNDVITGGAGNDTIDGKGGIDTAVYSGNHSDYKITTVNGVTTVTDLRAGSPDGTDTLTNVELLRFADGTTSIGANGTFVGGAENDTYVGGAGGHNTAVFTGKESDYLFTFNADGSVTVADQRSLGWNVSGTPDGTDTLKNIQQIQFADKTVNVSDIKAYTDANHNAVIIGGNDKAVLSAEHGSNVVIVDGGGSHIMFGSAGNNVYYVNNAGDDVVENPGNGDRGGIDEVRTTLSTFSLAGHSLADGGTILDQYNHNTIENLTYVGNGNFTGIGNDLNNVLTGAAGNDVFTGGAGNDTIDGKGGTNTAVYSGHESDYKITTVGDVTTITDLRAGSPDGTDTLKNIQLLQFADGTKHLGADAAPATPVATPPGNNHPPQPGTVGEALTGGAGNDTLVGGAGDDKLTGGAGNDTLDGKGGHNTAVYHGDASDYLFTFNADGSVTVADQRWHSQPGDTSPPAWWEGTDTLKNIQQLQFADKTVNVSDLKAYTDADHNSVVLGSADDRHNIGAQHTPANVVIADGGGQHMMFGGSGNNVYVVTNPGDVVVEKQGIQDMGGIDEVRTTLSTYSLSAVAANTPVLDQYNHNTIENLTYIGTGNFHGTGNDLNNVMTGGAGNDIFTGGAGNDTIDGKGGINTAVYSGHESDYKITTVGDVTTITDLRAGSPDGTDTLKNIQLLQFADGTKDLHSPGSVSIGNASITEGNHGSHIETFTLTRTGGIGAFDVHYATADGTAKTSDHDYDAKSGTVHFDAGVNTQTVSIVVNGDTKVEPNESYKVHLSGATNGATISHADGIGTIVNDDGSRIHPFTGDGISNLLVGNKTASHAVELNVAHIVANATAAAQTNADHINISTSTASTPTHDVKTDVVVHHPIENVVPTEHVADHSTSHTVNWHIV